MLGYMNGNAYMSSANRSNQALLNRALSIFLDEMVPCVIQEVEIAAGKPIETAALEVFGENQGNKFIEELANYDSNAMASQFALTRINLTVDLFWPIFKKRLRNKKVMSGALRQIAYAAVPGVAIEPELESLYVEQRLDDMSTVLRRIGAADAQRVIESMKESINDV